MVFQMEEVQLQSKKEKEKIQLSSQLKINAICQTMCGECSDCNCFDCPHFANF
jgi:hypothetical protein